MEYWLVRGRIRYRAYMNEDKPSYIEDMKMVKASNKEEAKFKFQEYWDNKTDRYSVYYDVERSEVVEIIE